MKFIVFVLLFVLLFVSNPIQAMPGPGGGGPPGPPGGGGPPCWAPPCVPIDGGIGLLVAGGIILGIRKLSKSKKRLS